MPGAALTFRDRTTGSRKSSGGRRALKALLVSSLAAFAGVGAVIGLVIGAERLLTASFHVQSGIRSAAIAPAAPEPAFGMARFPMSVAQQWYQVAQFIATHERLPMLTVASVERSPLSAPKLNDRLASADDDDITGSLGSSLSALNVGPVAPAVAVEAQRTLPLPKARPQVQLASLTPSNDPMPEDMSRTAVYDITGQTVYMPNGEKLEAHSGLGSMMDDPRSKHQKMRGVTPPNTYRLKMREALFHGVAAIRLLPERENEMFNRDGILAHTYMLGPSGQSNGCVSFKDYKRFLAAFNRGEVERMIVVESLPKSSSVFARLGAHKMKHISMASPLDPR